MKILIIVGCCIVAVLLLLILLIVFLKLKFSVFVDNEVVTLYLWKKKIYDSTEEEKETIKKSGKKAHKDKKIEKKYKRFKRIVNFFRKVLDDKNDDIINILKCVKKTFSIKKLDVSVDYGFGDAAITGVTGGIVWGIISNVSCFISRYIDINKFLNIAVTPHYTKEILDYKIEFVFYVRILNLLKTLRYIRRFKKTLEGGK